MHKWYEEGLICADFDKIASSEVSAAMINGEVFLSMGWLTGSMQNVQMYGEKQNENFQLKAVATPALKEGEIPEWAYATCRITGQGTTISKSCENVEMAARYLDFLFTEEGHVISNFGIEGESFDMVDGVPTFRTDVIKTPPKGYNQSQSAARYSLATTGAQAMVKHEAYYPQIVQEECCVEAIYIWNDGVKGGGFLHQLPGTLQFSDSESNTISAFRDATKLQSTNFAAEFIRGEKDIDADWTEYLAFLENAGLYDALSVMSNAMERYNNR